MNKYTNNNPKYENIARTIINRLGQKSISLPRISDDKRLRGYPGLAGTASNISKYIPNCYTYVEPLAGTAKVYQELLISPQYTILNDKSEFVVSWLKKEFPNVTVNNMDFIDCILKYDNYNTFFLIDAPWHRSFYDKSYSCFDRKDVKTYDEEILDICRTLKGKFIICSDRSNTRMLSSGFHNRLITGVYKIAGGYTKTLLTSNILL